MRRVCDHWKILAGMPRKVIFFPTILCDEQEVNIGVGREERLLI